MIKKIAFLILVFITSSCSAQNSLKNYYYSIGKEKEINVYKYVDQNNPKNIEYWKVTTNPKTNRILTESFTTEFRLYNIFEEELKNDGAEIIKYADFEKNDLGQNIRVPGTIVDKDVYKWSDSTKYKYSVKYKSPKYGNEQFLKERTKNNIEKIKVYGIEYSTLKFMDEYEVKSLENNESYKFYQFTYYAKDIGMVKYQRFHPDGTEIDLQLEKIITEKEFDKLSGKASR